MSIRHRTLASASVVAAIAALSAPSAMAGASHPAQPAASATSKNAAPKKATPKSAGAKNMTATPSSARHVSTATKGSTKPATVRGAKSTPTTTARAAHAAPKQATPDSSVIVRPKTTVRPAPVKPAAYANWAGYQASIAGPESIHGTWIVPKATWPGRDGYSAMWVGLGGGTAKQGELVQAGTESDVVCTAVTRGHCTKWKTSYYPWIETYPSRAQERITNLAVAPGDAVEVTVRYAAKEGRSYFTLCNWRTNDCVGTDRTSAAPRGVAEAVLERTSGADGRARALANVGSPTFSSVYAKGKDGTRNLAGWPSTRITMSTGAALAVPSGISRTGDTFSVSYRRPA